MKMSKLDCLMATYFESEVAFSTHGMKQCFVAEVRCALLDRAVVPPPPPRATRPNSRCDCHQLVSPSPGRKLLIAAPASRGGGEDFCVARASRSQTVRSTHQSTSSQTRHVARQFITCVFSRTQRRLVKEPARTENRDGGRSVDAPGTVGLRLFWTLTSSSNFTCLCTREFLKVLFVVR